MPQSDCSRNCLIGCQRYPLLALLAVTLWTWFGVLHQSALARRPGVPADLWTALIMVGAGLGMLMFAPLGYYAGLFRLPLLGFGW